MEGSENGKESLAGINFLMDTFVLDTLHKYVLRRSEWVSAIFTTKSIDGVIKGKTSSSFIPLPFLRFALPANACVCAMYWVRIPKSEICVRTALDILLRSKTCHTHSLTTKASPKKDFLISLFFVLHLQVIQEKFHHCAKSKASNGFGFTFEQEGWCWWWWLFFNPFFVAWSRVKLGDLHIFLHLLLVRRKYRVYLYPNN